MAPTLDEQIAQSLRDSQHSGELQAAPSWGKPLALGDGFDETPLELRMAFKMLKDALMREIAALRSQLALLDGEPTPAVAALRRRIVDLNANLALRLERLRVAGSL
jgi:hypothetical protein